MTSANSSSALVISSSVTTAPLKTDTYARRREERLCATRTTRRRVGGIPWRQRSPCRVARQPSCVRPRRQVTRGRQPRSPLPAPPQARHNHHKHYPHQRARGSRGRVCNESWPIEASHNLGNVRTRPNPLGSGEDRSLSNRFDREATISTPYRSYSAIASTSTSSNTAPEAFAVPWIPHKYPTAYLDRRTGLNTTGGAAVDRTTTDGPLSTPS